MLPVAQPVAQPQPQVAYGQPMQPQQAYGQPPQVAYGQPMQQQQAYGQPMQPVYAQPHPYAQQPYPPPQMPYQQSVQMMPMQPAPQPQIIIQQPTPPSIVVHHHGSGMAAPMNIDRSDRMYLDAADVAGCWLQFYCGILPACVQLDAVSPDEVGAPGCCCLGVWPCCSSPTPIYQRVGPRRFDHPEGNLVFTSDHSLVDEGKGSCIESCKLCGPGPWSCFDPWC